jgi:hypothetical protein
METIVPDNPFVALATAPHNDLREAKHHFSALYLAPRAGAAFHALERASPAPSGNVVGVGVAEKHSEGQPTGVMSVTFFVRRKYPLGTLPAGEALPRMVDGLPTDVEEVGAFQRLGAVASPAAQAGPANPRVPIRPIRPGSSISPLVGDAGTFGALVTDAEGRYILSNNHVIANEDQLPTGAPIIQPALRDGGQPAADVVAHFSRAVPLQAEHPNDVDAAIAALPDPGLASPDVLFIGQPAGVGPASVGMAVHKFGRTTSYTVGRVMSVDTDLKAAYPKGELSFREQIIIVGASGGAFANFGDSGSLVLERGSNRAVGLLSATGPSHAIAGHLQTVLDALAVTLV